VAQRGSSYGPEAASHGPEAASYGPEVASYGPEEAASYGPEEAASYGPLPSHQVVNHRLPAGGVSTQCQTLAELNPANGQRSLSSLLLVRLLHHSYEAEFGILPAGGSLTLLMRSLLLHFLKSNSFSLPAK